MFEKTFGSRFPSMAAYAVCALLTLGYARSSAAQEPAPRTFATPAEACNALFQAVQNEDEQTVEAILGAEKEVTSSSDEVEDKLEREGFRQKYREMHRLVQEPDGNIVLYIGMENWPFPIPLVSTNGRWYFDSKAGRQEILFRRIGANEATAIQVCNAVATAGKQPDPQSMGDDPISQFVKSLIAAGTPNADSNARTSSQQELYPFHGYYFRIMTEQSGKDGAAGANGVASPGKKTSRGVALIAFPADYRSSGVMTFLVTRDGAVYEKDLGPNTMGSAPIIKGRRPDSTWQMAE